MKVFPPQFIYDILPLSHLAVNIGLSCILIQVLSSVLFSSNKIIPKGPWTSLPCFSAHQVVALPLMIILTCCGFKEWFFKNGEDLIFANGTPYDRIFGTSNPNDIPLAVGTGAILLWDIPAGIFVPALQDTLMFIHHVGMFLVAGLISGMFCKNGQMIGYYYAPFYFGVIELSSIFLAYVDVFHPKREAWYSWLQEDHSNRKLKSLTKALNSINEVARVLFALSFLVLRGIYFPYISFVKAIPDLLVAFEKPPDGVPMWTCYFLCVALFLFSCLQAYWGLLITKQVLKVLGSDKKEIKKD